MKIECINKREGGTRADIGGVEYHFEPLSDGAHVADVTEEAHIDRFLSIPEGYKVYHGKAEPKGKPQPIAMPTPATVFEQPRITVPLAGSDQHPPQFEIAGTIYSQREIVERAFAHSGLTADAWNDLGDDERAAKLDIMLDTMAGDTTDERAELVAQYEAKFGKKPHHKTSIDTIKAKLAE